MLKAVRLLLLVGGAALAVYVFREHASTVQQSLAQVGWGFLIYLLGSLSIFLLDTWAWRVVFVGNHAPVSFMRVFWVQRAGEAANKVTPLASMGGEPLKAYLMTRDGTSMRDAIASVAIAKNVMTLAQIAFIFVGVALSIQLVPGKNALFLGFAAFPGAILTAIVITAIIDLRLRWLRKKSGGELPQDGRERKSRFSVIVEMWSQIADYFYTHPREASLSFVLFFLGWAAGALEMLAGAYVLNFPLSVTEAIAFEALIVSVNMATFLIPANVGTQEGGYVSLAPLLGVGAPHALALAVLRRCRDVLWIGFGLLYLALTEGKVLIQPRLEIAETTA